MPTFDFQCAKCDHVFEFNRPFGSKANPSCPNCGSKKTEKLLSVPAIAFKGSGWYKTDSRGTQKTTTKTESVTETSEKATKGAKETEGGAKKKKVTEAKEGKKESAGTA